MEPQSRGNIEEQYISRRALSYQVASKRVYIATFVTIAGASLLEKFLHNAGASGKIEQESWGWPMWAVDLRE